MTDALTGSVGANGTNRPDDIRTVYALLNTLLSVPLKVSDTCSAELIRGIRDFQQGFLSRPDGRIDVGGRTWRELTAAAERPEREGMEEISGSVGQGGRNRPQDVRVVYALFNEILSRPLEVSDQCTDELIQAIKDVQKMFMSRPDGRIDVDGRTWRRLTTPAGGTGKAVLLSFDDGPAPTGSLHSILDTLDRYGIKAEFYVLGQEVDSSPSAVQEIADRGHRVQNHSYTHPNLAGLSRSAVRKELKKTQESIQRAAGVTPTKIRPPYGAGGWSPYDRELAAVARELSLSIQNWDIDTEDWKSPKGLGPGKLAMIERQFSQRQNQTELNVLMHVLQDTAEDLNDFIEQLKQWGFSFARP
ncbi:MAG: polysaccharide deacetylase family protein [Candidatus Electrothrix sp. GW3-4]|uniref:polysaccharide deacetylase family protein n=1 Tax=Candidatus Electrothrix sp. GW3-4 TaxID=3126740 RepID=UPI0030CD29A9